MGVVKLNCYASYKTSLLSNSYWLAADIGGPWPSSEQSAMAVPLFPTVTYGGIVSVHDLIAAKRRKVKKTPASFVEHGFGCFRNMRAPLPHPYLFDCVAFSQPPFCCNQSWMAAGFENSQTKSTKFQNFFPEKRPRDQWRSRIIEATESIAPVKILAAG